MIRVILFEDSKPFSDTLKSYWKNSSEIFLSEVFPDANNALKQIREYKPDVVLMDIQMEGISGIDALQQIHEQEPQIPILMQTIFEDNHRIFCAICGGASGYVLKSAGPEAIQVAIKDVHGGGAYFSPAIAIKITRLFRNEMVKSQSAYVELTKTEQEVLEQVCKGLSYKLISDKLDRSIDAIRFHIKNIYKKLHVNSKSEAVLKAIRDRHI